MSIYHKKFILQLVVDGKPTIASEEAQAIIAQHNRLVNSREELKTMLTDIRDDLEGSGFTIVGVELAKQERAI
jgi:uncharacterized protein (UPF0335 family)